MVARSTTMKTVIEVKRWHAMFRSDDTLFRLYWRENHPVHSLPSCFAGFSLANALSPAWFSPLVAFYLSGSGHQHELFPAQRTRFIPYHSFHRFFHFFFFFLPFFLSFCFAISIDRPTDRPIERAVRWNFEVVLSLHVSRSIIRRSRTVPDYIEITRYNTI